MKLNYPNYYIFLLTLFLILSGHNNVFTQTPNYTANDQVTPYAGPFHFGTNLGYYPGWTDGQLGDLAKGNPTLGIPGIGATALRPGLFEHYLEDYGYDVNIPWFQHYESLGLEDHTLFIGYPSDAHRDPNFYCGAQQSTVFENMYLPIWDGGANGTPVNDDNYYALFLYKMVTLYGPYIKFWEIWNEPDLDFSPMGMGWREPGDPVGSWWDSNPDPCHTQLAAPIFYYNRLLRISWEVIKSLDPDAYVTVGGLGFPSYLDAMMRNTDNPVDGSVTAEYPLKGGAYFDVLSFHSYPHINGSLRIWDPINGITGYKRHSDAAIEGITEDLNDFKTVMYNYGYDGNTYPEKLAIMTESSIPRKKFGDYIGSEMAALNYAIKLPIELQKENVLQFHYYDLGEKENFDAALYPFQMTGFYEKLTGTSLPNIQRTNQGIAYKTVSDMLFQKTYDATKTAELNLPATIDGGAFKDANNQYTYVLWSVCQTDDSEASFSTYSFPSSFNLTNLESRKWDYALTNQQAIISAQNIQLTGSPIFLMPSNQQISFSCPSQISLTTTQNGEIVTWDFPTTSTLCSNSTVNVVQTGGLPSGSFFPIGTSTITYEISDNCGNIESCSFNVIIDFIDNTPPVTCPNNEHKVTINIIGNGSVDVEFIEPSGPTENCNQSSCTYCVPNGTMIKLVAYPDAGETFLGWNGSGCTGTSVCWKSITWETEVTASFSETQSQNMTLSLTPTDVSCNGESDGMIAVGVSGGAPIFTYNWSNGQSTPSLNNVPAGNYVVTVTDVNGTSAIASSTVNEPLQLLGIISDQTDISCIGNSDGAATATASGGVGPYNFAWSNGGNSATINNLQSGTYVVSVSDTNGCSTTSSTTILEANSATPIADFSKNISGLSVSFSDISSGNPSSWFWDFGDGTTNSGDNVVHTYSSQGNYSACLTVSNSCGQNTACQNISVGLTNNVIIALEDANGNAGTVVQVPVRVENFENIVSFQHSFVIPDTTVAVFVGTSNFTAQLGNSASINITSQTINTVWLTSNGNPISLSDGTEIYYLDVLIKGAPNSCVDIVMDSQNFPTEFVQVSNGNISQIGYDFFQGEICAQPGFVIAGMIGTENGLMIKEVEIFNNNILTDSTDVLGNYDVVGVASGNDAEIVPHKNINFVNGVTSFDLAIIQQHIVGNIILDSPYKIIAADIDHSGFVSSFDLFLAQQVIVGNVDTFPNNESWRFVPSNFVFPNPSNPHANPFPEKINLNDVTANITDQDFIAIKVGDVNHTALPNTLTGGDDAFTRTQDSELAFFIRKEKVNDEEFFIEFLAKDFKEMSAFQFDLFFEKEKIELIRMEEKSIQVSYGSSLLQNGILTLSWFDPTANGLSFEEETALFRIYFKNKNSQSSSIQDFKITQERTPPIAYEFSGKTYLIAFSFLEKDEAAQVETPSLTLYQNQPNPFHKNSSIYFKMNIIDMVEITFMDQHGKVIRHIAKIYPKGIHQIQIDADDFPSTGMYYYNFTTTKNNEVRKMIIQK